MFKCYSVSTNTSIDDQHLQLSLLLPSYSNVIPFQRTFLVTTNTCSCHYCFQDVQMLFPVSTTTSSDDQHLQLSLLLPSYSNVIPFQRTLPVTTNTCSCHYCFQDVQMLFPVSTTTSSDDQHLQLSLLLPSCSNVIPFQQTLLLTTNICSCHYCFQVIQTLFRFNELF